MYKTIILWNFLPIHVAFALEVGTKTGNNWYSYNIKINEKAQERRQHQSHSTGFVLYAPQVFN